MILNISMNIVITRSPLPGKKIIIMVKFHVKNLGKASGGTYEIVIITIIIIQEEKKY